MSQRIFSPFRYHRDEEQMLSHGIEFGDYVRYVNNINTMVRRHDRRVEVVLVPMEIDYHLHGYELRVLRGGELVHLNREEKDLLIQLSEDAYKLNPGYSILLDMDRSIRYKSTIMPKEWIQSVIPLILTENQIIDNKYLYDIFFNNAPSYRKLIELLLSLYKRGSIVTIDQGLIERWELITDKYEGIYHPSWWNTLVTADTTRYLMDVSNGLISFDSYNEAMKFNYSKYVNDINVDENMANYF